jgi:hypothetical protein
MPTILETTIVALTVQVGARDIDSICHETGLSSGSVANALESLSRRRALKRTNSGRFSAHELGTVKTDKTGRKFSETLRPTT